MARYRGTIRGQRGEASRLGSAKSGLSVYANGWDVGAKLFLNPDGETDEDEVTIYLTGGSNGWQETRFLGRFTRKDLTAKTIVQLPDDVVNALQAVCMGYQDAETAARSALYAHGHTPCIRAMS